MTELDAINVMLSNVGEAPVTEVNIDNPEVGTAKIVLDQVNREVCSEGWDFNIDKCFTIQPDVDGNIILPSNAIRVTGARSDNYLVETAQRDGKLWNKRDFTFEWGGPLMVDIVWYVSFDGLPGPFQDYVAQRAARVFVGRTQGNMTMLRAAAADEERLRNNCLNWDIQNRQPNMLDSRQRYPVMLPNRPSDVMHRIPR